MTATKYARCYANAIRYSRSDRDTFADAVNKSPHDRVARGAFADFLEENEHPADWDTLRVLREHDGPVYAETRPDGVT